MREVAASPTQLLPVNQIGNNFKSYLQNRGESVQETAKTLEPRATAFPWLFSFVRFLIHRQTSLVVLSYSMITNFSIVVFRKRYLTHITTALRVFWAPSRLARLSLGQPCTGNVDSYQK